MATTVARLEAVLSADTRDFDRGMTTSEGRMKGASKAITIGSLAIVGGVGLMAKASINAAADYEAGLNTMRAVSGATADQMKDISKLAMQLGNDIKLPGTSAKDAAEAMTELSKSGMTIKQTMAAVRPTLLLSAAAQISNARAAEITSNALNAFGLDASRTSKVVDILANAANSSSLEIEDVADSMKMAGAVFKGIQGPVVGAENSLKDLTVATALLGNAGIKGSDAGTSLKQSLLALASPSDKTKDAMRALHLAAGGATVSIGDLTAMSGTATERSAAMKRMLAGASDEMKKGGDIAYDAAGRMRSYKDIIAEVAKGTKGMTDEQRSYYISQIFGADASRAIIALMAQSGKGWDNMTAAVNKNGAAQELANAKMTGMRGAQEALKSTMDTLAITFGLVLLPYVTKFTQALTSATGVVAEHQRGAIVVTGVLVALAAVWLTTVAAMKLYSAAVVVGTAATAAFAALSGLSAWVVLLGSIRSLRDAQILLNIALTANPIGIVVVAIAAFAAGIFLAYQKSVTFRNAVEDAWAAVKQFGGWIKEHWGAISSIVEKSPIVLQFKLMKVAVEGVFDALNNVLKAIKDVVSWLGKIKVPDIKRPDLNPFNNGDPRDPTRSTGAGAIAALTGGGGNLMGAGPELGPFASLASTFGLGVSSGFRENAVTANGTPSDHGRRKAIDVAGSAAGMMGFISALVGNPRVKQAFFDPFGSIFGGVRSAYREGGHTDHVHVATYDKGGVLPPGLTVAYNGTGRNEYVSRGDQPLEVMVYLDGEQIWQSVQRRGAAWTRRNGGDAFR